MEYLGKQIDRDVKSLKFFKELLNWDVYKFEYILIILYLFLNFNILMDKG